MRKNNRVVNETRSISIDVGLLKNANGSARFSFGNTTALVGVFGPQQVVPKHEEDGERAILRTRYSMAAFSTTTRSRPGPSRRSQEISKVTREALMPVMFVEEFPKTAIDVHIEILEADASTRLAGINATAVALADAGIPMRDLIAGCSAGKVNGTIMLDIEGKEDTDGELDMAVALYPKKREITLLQMDGITDKDEFKKILALALEGCERVYDKQRNALREKYEVEDTGDNDDRS